MRLNRILIFFIFFVFLLSNRSSAQTHLLPLNKMGYDTDIVVKGANITYNAQFPLPAGKLLPGSFVQITVEPAQYLQNTGSFTFFLNDQPVLSTSVAKLRAAPTIRLPLPANAMDNKLLRLTIKSHLFVTDDICTDYRRGQLYYLLRNTSGLTLQFTPTPVATIPDFLRSLYPGLMVVIPDQPTPGELAAGAWAYGVMQKTFPYYPVQIIRASERDLYPALPRLWVGTRDHLPPALIKGDAGIQLPFANALVITGKDEAELKHNTRSLGKVAQLEVLPAISADASKMKAEPSDGKNLVRFGSTIAQDGIITIPMDFLLYPGQLGVPPYGLGVHLEGRYSVNIRPEHSVRLDVYFNRNLIHSELLDHSGQLKRDFALPKHLTLKARNVLTTEFHYPEVDGACEVRGPAQSAQMFFTSYFIGNGKFAYDAHSWDSLGMSFFRDGVIALDALDAKESPGVAARLALLLNNQLPAGTYAFPEFTTISELKNHQLDSYLIVAGLAENLPVELHESLPIKPGRANTAIHQNASSILYNHQVGSQTVIGQTGNYKKVPLALISANSSRQSLIDLLERMNSLVGQSQLSGNILIYNAPNSLAYIDTRDPNARMTQPGIVSTLRDFWDESIRLVEQYPKTVFSIIALVTLAVLLRLYLGTFKKKGR